VALLVAVAAPVGGVPGTRHVVRQVAAWELHVIMQFVSDEDCASRILPPANTVVAEAPTAQPISTIAKRLVRRRIDCLRASRTAII
jgi:hypothetical protein